MPKKWMIYNKKDDFAEISRKCGISPVLARLIRNRDVIGVDEVSRYIGGTTADLYSPLLLHGMEQAVEIIAQKIAQGKKIRVIGDYDVDGICSSYILYRSLTFLGGDVSVELPDRIRDGYGINERLVDDAVNDGVDTIITCDNGIAAAKVLQRAKDAGLTVIVTDHHEIPFETEGAENKEKHYLLPPADVIVEPKMADPATGKTYYPFPDICGAAVTFKLAQVMLGMPDITGDKSDDESGPQKVLRELIAFAGIATICDVMPLISENRILARYGLREAERTENPGLAALIRVQGLTGQKLCGYHAGFIIGPCLNASGRLESASEALDLFREKDPNKALAMADQLKALNDGRKTMTVQGTAEAERQIRENIAAGRDDRVLVIRIDDLHESLAGIVAGRIREHYARPVIVLTPSDDSAILKGSGRSIEAYDMFAELSRVKDIFTKFGGHKMAAGLSLPKEKEGELRERLNANCTLRPEEMTDVLHIDMVLPPAYATVELVHELELMEPLGNGNEAPQFALRNVRLTPAGVFGKNRNVCRFNGVLEDGSRCQFTYFVHEEDIQDISSGTHLCHVVYRPGLNEYRGQVSVQLKMVDYMRLD
jgi:single-stranded-DNA-specific exonuclease